MATETLVIQYKTKYVEGNRKTYGELTIGGPHKLGKGKSGYDGKRAEIAYKRIKAFADKEIRRLRLTNT